MIDNIRKSLSQDYLAWGFALAILLTIIDYAHDGYALVYFIVAFLILEGVSNGIKTFTFFMKSHF